MVDELYIFIINNFNFAFVDNFPPKIVNESNVINVTLHETVELIITAVDNDTVKFRVINEPPKATVDQRGNMLYFTWNVTSSQKVGYRLSCIHSKR